MWGIMGKGPGQKRYRPFDFAAGRFVTNIIYQTLWDDKAHVEDLVAELNKLNPEHHFRIQRRE